MLPPRMTTPSATTAAAGTILYQTSTISFSTTEIVFAEGLLNMTLQTPNADDNLNFSRIAATDNIVTGNSGGQSISMQSRDVANFILDMAANDGGAGNGTAL